MHARNVATVLLSPFVLLAACVSDEAQVTDVVDDVPPAVDEAPLVKTGWIPGPHGDFMEVTYEERADGSRVFQGDILLGRVWSHEPREGERAAIKHDGRWGHNRVPYRIAGTIPNPQRIYDAVAEWNLNTPYMLVPYNGEDDYVMFDRHGTDCASPVGMQGGEQEVQVADACSTGAIIHEIGHAIGMWHEQSRQDRDAYVNINLANVQNGKGYNFDKYNSSEGYDWGLYDYGSIMHYGSYAFAIDGTKPTITKKDGSVIDANRAALSPLDRAATWNSGTSGDPLRLKWLGVQSAHGWPLDRPNTDGAYRYLPTQGGRIYAHSASGPYTEVHGDIAIAYGKVGWATGFLGLPTTDELAAPDGRGRFNHFQNGSIYWTPQTGAHTIYGAIRDKWNSIGAQASFFGYPTTDESAAAHSGGRYNHFEGGSIYYSPATWVHTMWGAIRDKYFAMGAEGSYLGFPTTDESGTPDGIGRYNQFQGGAIYCTPWYGPVAVNATVRTKWAQLGWETGCLGYPTADFSDYGAGSGVQQFQRGTVWINYLGQASALCDGIGWL